MAVAQLPDESNGEAFFLSKLDVIEKVISFVCARHHLSSVDADDFRSHVMLKLIEDNYRVLRKFQGRSSLRTFLTIVINRLFLDHRNNQWGKWRPSAEAKRLGPIAVLLEQLMGRDGHTFEEACELLETNHRVTTSRSELEAMAARLPVRMRRRFESEDALDQVAADQPGPDEIAAERERNLAAARAAAALEKALAKLAPRDRLILRLRYQDGVTVADIARLLECDQKGLFRYIDRLLKRLRRALKRNGIDWPW
jgi:RNA polymerase sigma factor (sigma-70 family)